MFRQARYAAAAMAAALLAACGGGSNDDQGTPPPAAVTSAEGFWLGKASTGYDVAVAILDGGDTWSVYSRDGVIQGAVHGTTISSDGRLRGSGAQFDIGANTVTSRAYEGSYTAQQDIRIWFGFDAFSGTYSQAYKQPASLAQLAGTYQGIGVSTGSTQMPVTLSISPTGAVATEPMQGCTAQGSAAPRPGGKNLFDLRIVFAGDSCALGHGAIATGVAFYENGALTAMGLLPSQVQGFIFMGNKATQPPVVPPATRATAEGLWIGKASSGYDTAVLVLDNGETWAMSAAGGRPYYAQHGQTVSSGGKLSGAGMQVDLYTGKVIRDAFSGSYIPMQSIQAQLGNGSLFNGSYSAYYDQPTTLAQLAGTYRGEGFGSGTWPQWLSLTISATGVVSTPPSVGCSSSGRITRRPGGKSVFDLQATFSGANCALGDGATASGIVYYENGLLLAMALTPSEAGGIFFWGQR